MIDWKTTQLPTLGPVLASPLRLTRRMFRWFSLSRFLLLAKWAAITAVCISVLVVLLYFIENRRAKQEWEQIKNDLEAQGVPMDWNRNIPEPIPDEINFVLAPVIAHFQYKRNNPHHVPWQERWGSEEDFERLFQRNKGGVIGTESFLLRGEAIWHESRFESHEQRRERLKSEGVAILPAEIDPWEQLENSIAPHQQLLVDLRAAARSRPKSFIEGDYTVSPLEVPIPSLSCVRNLTNLLFADALCAIRNGDAERVFENAHTISRLGDLNPGLYFPINHMMSVVARKGFEIPIYQLALKEGLLDDSQLNRLIEESLERNALGKFEQSMKLDIAANSEAIISESEVGRFLLAGSMNQSWTDRLAETFWKTVFKSMPKGWTYIMAGRSAHYMSLLLDFYDEETRMLDSETMERNRQTLGEMIRNIRFFDLLAAITLPASNKIIEQSLQLHCQQDMLGIACALEQYRRTNGDLPEKLEALVPRFLPKLYKDPVSGENYRYERLDPQRYRLWGVGIDGKDDGGRLDTSISERDQADVIWPLATVVR